jgi:anti-sigma B factor antagonist
MLTENSVNAVNDIAVLRLSGRFDAHKQQSVSHWASHQRQNGIHTLVMDLSNVNFIDSAALTWALQETNHCRQQAGDLLIYNPTPTVRIILQLTGLEGEFHLWSPDANTITDLHTVTTIL